MGTDRPAPTLARPPRLLYGQMVLAVARTEMKEYVRSRAAFAYGLLIPSFFLVVALALWYPEAAAGFAVPDVATMFVIATGLFAIGIILTERRKDGTLKTYLASPLPASAFLVGFFIARLLVLIVATIVMIGIAVGYYGLRPQGSLLALVPALVLTSATMFCLGWALSSLYRSVESAGIISGLLFFGAWVATGIGMPPELLPTWVDWLFQALPFQPTVELLRDAWLGTSRHGAWVSGAKLLAWCAVLAFLSVRWFRWTPDDR